jgi:hypothetical protein
MIETVSSSETSVNIYQAIWCYKSEDSHFHTRRRENLKSQQCITLCKSAAAPRVHSLSEAPKAQKQRSLKNISDQVI